VTDRLGRLLLVTLEAVRINADLPVLGALRSWLDSWRWRATFYTTGMEHSITSATASAWQRTPWHAVQGRGARGIEGSGKSDVSYATSACTSPHGLTLPGARLR